MWSDVEGVGASVMQLTATFPLQEPPPPADTMRTKRHISKKTPAETLFEGSVMIWAHEQTAGKIIFEQVRLLLHGYQKDLLCYKGRST